MLKLPATGSGLLSERDSPKRPLVSTRFDIEEQADPVPESDRHSGSLKATSKSGGAGTHRHASQVGIIQRVAVYCLNLQRACCGYSAAWCACRRLFFRAMHVAAASAAAALRP